MQSLEKSPQQNSDNTNELPQHECGSCAYHYQGHFCPRCGQKYIGSRFTLKQSFLWIFDQILNLEKGIWYTTKILLVNPAKGIKDFLSGATVRYMHPFRFVFVLATLSALLTVLFSIEQVEAYQQTSQLYDGTELNPRQVENTKKVMEIFKKYLALFLMLAIPFNAMGSALIYKKKKYNYTEHLILNAYAYGLTLMLSIPLYLLFILPNGIFWNGAIGTMVYFLGLAWVFSKFFKEHFIESILKVILLSILALIFLIIIGGILTAIFVIAYVGLIK